MNNLKWNFSLCLGTEIQFMKHKTSLLGSKTEHPNRSYINWRQENEARVYKNREENILFISEYRSCAPCLRPKAKWKTGKKRKQNESHCHPDEQTWLVGRSV